MTGEPSSPLLYLPGPANPSMYKTRLFHLAIIGSHASQYRRRISCFLAVCGSKSQTVPSVLPIHLVSFFESSIAGSSLCAVLVKLFAHEFVQKFPAQNSAVHNPSAALPRGRRGGSRLLH